MLKEKLFISDKKAKAFICDMIHYSDTHFRNHTMPMFQIKQFFEQKGYKWQELIHNTRRLSNIPLVENIAGYIWYTLSESDKTNATIYQHGHETTNYNSDNFEFNWEKQGIWGVMASQANKMSLSYELCQVNKDGFTRQKNNLHILLDNFDSRLNEVVNLQDGYSVEFKFNSIFE